MAQNQETSRTNVSLTGDSSKLLRKLHTQLQKKHEPMNVSMADVVAIALTKLEAELVNIKS
jgi:hypothetical protein